MKSILILTVLVIRNECGLLKQDKNKINLHVDPKNNNQKISFNIADGNQKAYDKTLQTVDDDKSNNLRNREKAKDGAKLKMELP